jgi:hypothetical protein
VTDEFRSWRLATSTPAIEAMMASVRFDDVTNGRRGAVLVAPDTKGVPIVRTTTPYAAAAQLFQPIHARLAQEISESGRLPQPFNNALAEHYTNAYAKMKYHSDQAQDLAEGSWIAVYSCYREPALASRRLMVQPKAGGAAFEVPLEHGSVVAFSVDDNQRFLHAIRLRSPAPNNEWLGITFRTSKTFLRFIDGRPTLPDGTTLTLASEDERREFLKMRRRENEEMGFMYPPISYTLSESDLLPPAGHALGTRH